jgi:hypothetical protein
MRARHGNNHAVNRVGGPWASSKRQECTLGEAIDDVGGIPEPR